MCHEQLNLKRKSASGRPGPIGSVRPIFFFRKAQLAGQRFGFLWRADFEPKGQKSAHKILYGHTAKLGALLWAVCSTASCPLTSSTLRSRNGRVDRKVSCQVQRIGCGDAV
jgi:hypothetical protein